MRQRVLITGATGFLGLPLARALAADHHVLAIVRPGRSHDDRPARELRALGVELVEAELTDRAALAPSLRGVSAVYHLAGRLLRADVDPAEYSRVHVAGTRALLEACAEAGPPPRIVHVSTTGIHGPTGDRRPDEDAPPAPATIYERTKAEGEAMAIELAGRHGLHLTVARPGLVYGPGDLHLLGWFRAIAGGLYRVVGDGRSLLHPIYIDDLTAGLISCGRAPAPRRAYHLVGAEPVSIAELARAIATALGRPLPRGRIPLGLAYAAAAAFEALPGLPPERRPLTRERVAFMTTSRAYCGRRAREELGFTPATALPDGLARTVAWYRSEGHLPA